MIVEPSILHVTAISIKDLTAEVRFRLLVDVIEDYSIYLLDVDGTVVTWNSGAQRNKGYTASEVIGQPFEIFFDASARAEGKPERLLREASSYGRVEDEGWRIRKGGDRFWASVQIFAVRDSFGDLLGFAKITRDCTRQLQQEALRRSRDDAIAESRAKAELLAQMSHEIRTPLNAIIGFAQTIQLLYANLSEAKKFEYLDAIHTGASTLATLVQDILDRQRALENGEIVEERIDVDRVLLDMSQEFVILIGHRLQVQPSAGRYWAKGDAARLARILRNFISNAVKYAGACGHIRLGCRLAADDDLLISVEDDGPGIPIGREKTIFQRYYRLQQHKSVEGFGLGLSICRDLAQEMNGDIGAGRSPMGGAQFWVKLPQAVEE